MNIPIVKILFDFGYVLTFGILGIITLFLDIPKEKEMNSYKRARRTLGSALMTLSAYCIIRLIIPQDHTQYVDFWLLVTFTLIHAWLTYATLLFLLETPRFLTKHFLIDGIAPATILLLCGAIGLLIPSSQDIMMIIFGCIFGLKCTYMFYICQREYNKCVQELNEYYDESPHIKWIKGLIHLSLFMSVATIVAFYVHSIHFFYYLSIPIIYGYIVIKILNFAPKKIDAIRKKNDTLVVKPAEEKKKSNDLSDKISPLVDAWIKEKKFCLSELNIKDVAAEMGTNHNYLSSYLNNHVGQTFQVWLNTLRIEESKTILTNGEKLSIEEVGMQVGIPQSYNFSRWFKIVTGTTPYQYRKQH